MSTGNYDYDNFVRVDCALPPDAFWVNAVHETAHFTLVKQSAYGLLCFFLRQDTRDARSPLANTLRRLEQAFECVNEGYARTKELLLCTAFPAARRRQRERMLDAQAEKPYYARYHMERLDPLLRRFDETSRSPVFPDALFLLAANADVTPLLEADLTDTRRIESLILAQQARLCPDHRLRLLLEAYERLARRLPGERITVEALSAESGLVFMERTPQATQNYFRRLYAALSFRPALKELLARNMERLRAYRAPYFSQDMVADSFALSLRDCVIPAQLTDRFGAAQTQAPAFRPEKNVVAVFLEPEPGAPPARLREQGLRPGPRSAFLRFLDTKAGINYSDVFAQDLDAFRACLRCIPARFACILTIMRSITRRAAFAPIPCFSVWMSRGTPSRRSFRRKGRPSVDFSFRNIRTAFSFSLAMMRAGTRYFPCWPIGS